MAVGSESNREPESAGMIEAEADLARHIFL